MKLSVVDGKKRAYTTDHDSDLPVFLLQDTMLLHDASISLSASILHRKPADSSLDHHFLPVDSFEALLTAILWDTHFVTHLPSIFKHVQTHFVQNLHFQAF